MAELSTEYTRLHITPFTPTLLNVLLPPSILPSARNISYHSIQTFPEKAYGYVELPKMDAEKIKKKLHGSILKGTKVKIETARPRKEVATQDGEPAKPKKEKEMKDSKKRKRGQETIPAVEIGDRIVKRGWTTPASAISKKAAKDEDKAVVKSKYTTSPECLFKTVLPPNVAANVEKKKRKADKTVVHEFEKTTKYATFLRGAAGPKKKSAAEYVEGKGWVDVDGNVVEVMSKKQRRPRTPKEAVEPVSKSHESTPEDGSSEVSSSSDEEEEAVADPPDAETAFKAHQSLMEDSPTSSSGSSPDETSDSSDESNAESTSEEEKTPKQSTSGLNSISRPQSSSGPSSGLSITIPDSGITSTPIVGEVHPLEALYKRPRPDALNPVPKPTSSTFNFFGADEDDGFEEESRDQVPLTPFTQKDYEYRGIRSAAPTPDTAHANKRFIWPTDNEEDEEGEDEPSASSPTRKDSSARPAQGAQTGEAESDFQKWFYENRGETSRAWKKRRKVVAKEKRQRENRKRNDH